MNPDLKQMEEIRQVEVEMKGLKVQAERLEEAISKENHLLEAAEKKLADSLAGQKTSQTNRRALETQLSEAEGRLTNLKQRLGQVRNPKEATALQHELDAAEVAVAAAEENAFVAMEAETSAGESVVQAQVAVRKQRERHTEERARLDMMLKEKKELFKALKEQRVMMMNQLRPELKEDYTWLVKKHGPGSALSQVAAGACHECGQMLVPSLVLAVKQDPELMKCNHCYRFLWSEE